MSEITAADREHAAKVSGLSVEQVALLTGDTRDALTGNACRVAVQLQKKQSARPVEKPAEDDGAAIDPAKLAAAIAKRVRF
ncbi:hypothetical protein [Streptomyces sp. NPDC087787]|uniref:hypothetical protein n=1 Tax=Streptomyces sp. NPDC087787 TaxID=3365803 RepID=UPI00380D90CC